MLASSIASHFHLQQVCLQCSLVSAPEPVQCCLCAARRQLAASAVSQKVLCRIMTNDNPFSNFAIVCRRALLHMQTKSAQTLHLGIPSSLSAILLVPVTTPSCSHLERVAFPSGSWTDHPMARCVNTHCG